MSHSYRLKISRPSLKLKVATRIPVQLVGGTGVTITKTNGTYTFDMDITELEDIAEATANAAVAAAVGVDVQAQDADLQALADNSTNGLWAHTAAGTGAARTLTAPAAGLTITNPAGIAGNPTFVLADDLAAVEGLATTGIVRRTGASTWSAGTAVALASEVSGNLPVAHLNSGSSASADTFWSGDGLWTVPVLSSLTSSLGADVNLNNTANYFDGPSVGQGVTGTWFAFGTVTVTDTTAARVFAKLWDGTTVVASAETRVSNASGVYSISLSGYLSSPAGNIRISCRDATNTSGKILFDSTGNSKDSTISVFRIG